MGSGTTKGFVEEEGSSFSDFAATAATHSASKGSLETLLVPPSFAELLKLAELSETVPEVVPIPELPKEAMLFWEPWEAGLLEMISEANILLWVGSRSVTVPSRRESLVWVGRGAKKFSDPREWALKWARGGARLGDGLDEGLATLEVLATIVPNHWSGFGKLLTFATSTAELIGGSSQDFPTLLSNVRESIFDWKLLHCVPENLIFLYYVKIF